MNKLFKTAILLICAAALGSCADLDIQSDGRIGYEDIFGHYERTVNYYNRCIGYVPQIGFLYSNTPLASFCDEAHDASDYADGPVSRWYRGYTSTTYTRACRVRGRATAGHTIIRQSATATRSYRISKTLNTPRISFAMTKSRVG